MKVLFRSWHVIGDLILLILFWTCAYFTPNKTVLLLTNSMVLAGSIGVSITYIPAAIQSIRTGKDMSVQHITLGIAYAWSFSAAWRAWSLLWLLSNQPSWMINNDLVAFFQAGIFRGSCYHLTAPGAIAPNIPSLRWMVLGIIVGTAVGLAAVLSIFHPDLTQFVQVLRPYVPQ